MTEKIYISVYIQSLILVCFYMLYNNVYVGEFASSKLLIGKIELIIYAIYSIIIYFAGYILYKISISKRFVIKNYSFYINIKKLFIYYFIWLLCSLIFVKITGVGVLLSNATNSFSPIFNFLNVTYLFPVIYLFCRKSQNIKKNYFFLLVLLFLIYRLFQGWTSDFLMVFIFEIYFYFKDKNIFHINKILLVLIVPSLIILLGGIAYKFIYPLKQEIRGFGYSEISYDESIIKLTQRITFFSEGVGTYLNSDQIARYYRNENIELKEVKGLFRPITPHFLMKNKSFRSLNNNILQPIYPNITEFTSSNPGLISYVISIYKSSKLDTIVWFLLTCFLLFLAKIVYDLLSQYPGQLNFLLFILIIRIINNGSLEMVFGYSFLGLLYFLPVLLILGILKVKKNDN